MDVLCGGHPIVAVKHTEQAERGGVLYRVPATPDTVFELYMHSAWASAPYRTSMQPHASHRGLETMPAWIPSLQRRPKARTS